AFCLSAIGWRAAIRPADHPAANFEFDVVVGADGRRNTLEAQRVGNHERDKGKLQDCARDYMDTQMLLSSENVNQEALLSYAREAADFGTNYQLPTLDYAMNHCGQPDVAMFDFTSMHASENAALVRERFGHQLLVALVGDSLLEVRDGMADHAHFRC
ncbi:hypothetical protein GOODEAATRI_007648, partial [Goodea atripinnis]